MRACGSSSCSRGCSCFALSRRPTGFPGLRAGYVIGSPAAASFIGSLAPTLGVNALTQAAVLQALRVGDRDIARRRALVLRAARPPLRGLCSRFRVQRRRARRTSSGFAGARQRRGACHAPRAVARAGRAGRSAGRRALRTRGDPRRARDRPPALGAPGSAGRARARIGAGRGRAGNQPLKSGTPRALTAACWCWPR